MKLNVIVPLRDRNEILDLLMFHMTKIFEKQNIEPCWFLVYQDNKKLFNKGIISNVAFDVAADINYTDNYLFNDVTSFSRNEDSLNYNFKIEDNTVYHFFGNAFCLNRFFILKKDTFIKGNGYSNQYNGWGYEDTDLQHRFDLGGIVIDRSNFVERFRQHKQQFIDIVFEDTVEKFKDCIGTYTHLHYNSIYSNNKTLEEIVSIHKADGLNSLNTHKVTKEVDRVADNIYKIKVDFEI